MDTQEIVNQLVLRKPLDFIPHFHSPRIMGLESEYGCYMLRSSFENQFLRNGGLLYHDNGHPEYCTPEVADPFSAVLYYEAGKVLTRQKKVASELYCNNNGWSDENHHEIVSYGAHESYTTVAPKGSWPHLIPFLIARVVMCGAGWINPNNDYKFEISQRASQINTEIDADTVQHKPVLNLRDEPLMNLLGNKRLHITCGDATMNQISTLLRIGVTSLVIEMLELGVLPHINYRQKAAVQDLQGIARRTSGWYMGGLPKYRRCLLSFLYLYYEKAYALFYKRDTSTDIILSLWKDTLDKLGRDPMLLYARIDWVAKLHALLAFEKESNCTNKWLMSQDMEYHNLDPDNGLYHLLEEQGDTELLFSRKRIEKAVNTPPHNTRAYARGCLVEYLEKSRLGVVVCWREWDKLIFTNPTMTRTFGGRDIGDPFSSYSNVLPSIISELKAELMKV